VGKIDPEGERQRLQEVYSAMNDLELQKVGQDPSALTELAFEALQREMTQRGLSWPGKDISWAACKVVAKAHSGDLDKNSSSLAFSRANRTESGDSQDAPVVLRIFRDMPEALAARMTLESAGIECSLFDETFVRMDWLCSNAVGGMKLVARRSDADEALKILDENASEDFDQKG
jgi:hypothetical protein